MFMKNKIIASDTLKEIVTELKTQGKKVVATSGCFDILHAGHVTYLEEAAAKGDVFIVFLNSDQSVKRLKGETRPIVPEHERATVLAGLGCINYVCLFDENTPCEMINKIMPDSFIKGGDYAGTHIPEMDSVAVYGGKVEYVSMVDGCSTTNIIEKIMMLGGKDR